jgi:uncharacterized protein involved in propanediol utilization
MTMEALDKRVSELQVEMKSWSNIEILVEFESLIPFEGKRLDSSTVEAFCQYKAVRMELFRRLGAYEASK